MLYSAYLVEREVHYRQVELQRELEQAKLVREATRGRQPWAAGLLNSASAALGRLRQSASTAVPSVREGTQQPQEQCC